MSYQDSIQSAEFPQEDSFEQRNSLHYYRTEIPNCVLDAKLDPYSFFVYVTIKRITGDNGQCFMSLKNLSEKCSISLSKLQECLKILCEKNDFINSPFLLKTIRKKENGGDASNIYTVVDLWPFNMRYYSNKHYGYRNTVGGGYRNKTGGDTAIR